MAIKKEFEEQIDKAMKRCNVCKKIKSEKEFQLQFFIMCDECAQNVFQRNKNNIEHDEYCNLHQQEKQTQKLIKDMGQLKNQYIKLENMTNQIFEQQKQLLEINKELKEKLNHLLITG